MEMSRGEIQDLLVKFATEQPQYKNALKANCGACGRDAAPPPRVLLIAPPPLARQSEFADFFEGAAEKLLALPGHYRALAQQFGCEFFDASTVVTTSDIDGIHWEATAHAIFGEALARLIEPSYASGSTGGFGSRAAS